MKHNRRQIAAYVCVHICTPYDVLGTLAGGSFAALEFYGIVGIYGIVLYVDDALRCAGLSALSPPKKKRGQVEGWMCCGSVLHLCDCCRCCGRSRGCPHDKNTSVFRPRAGFGFARHWTEAAVVTTYRRSSVRQPLPLRQGHQAAGTPSKQRISSHPFDFATLQIAPET